MRCGGTFKQPLKIMLLLAVFFVALERPAAFQNLPGLDAIKEKISNKLAEADVQKILQGPEAITTSFSDAVTEIAFLDDFDPPQRIPLTTMKQDKDGRFSLIYPGLFYFSMQSYCLRAGSYSPTQGDGYLLASPKGKQAGIVRHVLQHSYAHPEIPRAQIQGLLWAIVARTKISTMPREYQDTAGVLLDGAELKQLEGGALGLVPPQVMDKLLSAASGPLGNVLQAEAKVRSLFSRGDFTYEELERAAVLSGEAPAEPKARNVPWGRWSYHPSGYLVRYFPSGYTKTEVQIYVPERFRLTRDVQGRLAGLARRWGGNLEISYQDQRGNGQPSTAGAPISAYAFQHIRFAGIDWIHGGKWAEGEWVNRGWALTSSSASKEAGSRDSRFQGWAERDQRAQLYKAEVQRLNTALGEAGTGESGTVEVLAQLAEALRVMEKETPDPALTAARAFVERAWVSAFTQWRRGKLPLIELADLDASSFPGIARIAHLSFHDALSETWENAGAFSIPRPKRQFNPGATPFLTSWLTPQAGGGGSGQNLITVADLTDGIAVPASTCFQRLIGSGRNDGMEPCWAAVQVVNGEGALNGEPLSGCNVLDITNGEITTGKKGRVQITLPDGSTLRFGANTKFKFNPSQFPAGSCQQPSGNIEQGKIDMSGDRFEIEPGDNCPSGVRGQVGPAPLALPQVLPAAWHRFFQATSDLPQTTLEPSVEDLQPEPDEIANQPFEVMVDYEPMDHLIVKALKGGVTLSDSSGATRTLLQGEVFNKKFNPSAPPSEYKAVVIRSGP